MPVQTQYIEDHEGNRLYYRFTPASLLSNFVPLIVILHDENGNGAEHFEYKMWNVLTPIYEPSERENAVPWLSSEGKVMTQELIANLVEEHECDEHLYLYGKGVGAFGAIVHGILSDANAVYVNGLKLLDDKTIDACFDQASTQPIFFINPNSNLDNDQSDSFTELCNKRGVVCRFDILPGENDEEILDVLKQLEKVASEA